MALTYVDLVRPVGVTRKVRVKAPHSTALPVTSLNQRFGQLAGFESHYLRAPVIGIAGRLLELVPGASRAATPE